jgi:hypothetical protein
MTMADTVAPLPLHLGKPCTQLPDTLSYEPTIGFQLRLTRAAKTDTATLTLKVGPSAHQPRRQVMQLGEFNLQLALVTARPEGKDVEDQGHPVNHPASESTGEVTLLSGCQGMIKNDQICTLGLTGREDLVGLPGADKQCGIRAVPAATHHGHHHGASRCRQSTQLGLVRGLVSAQSQRDENRARLL